MKGRRMPRAEGSNMREPETQHKEEQRPKEEPRRSQFQCLFTERLKKRLAEGMADIVADSILAIVKWLWRLAVGLGLMLVLSL